MKTSFYADATLNGKRITALVDSGCTRTCVSNRWIEEHDVPYRTKKRPISVRLADGNAPGFGKGMINLETEEIALEASGFGENRAYDIIDIGELDIILGLD